MHFGVNINLRKTQKTPKEITEHSEPNAYSIVQTLTAMDIPYSCGEKSDRTDQSLWSKNARARLRDTSPPPPACLGSQRPSPTLDQPALRWVESRRTARAQAMPDQAPAPTARSPCRWFSPYQGHHLGARWQGEGSGSTQTLERPLMLGKDWEQLWVRGTSQQC